MLRVDKALDKEIGMRAFAGLDVSLSAMAICIVD
jgi:hypothetical protein